MATKLFKLVFIASSMFMASATANAQSFNASHEMNLDLGDVRAAHASKGGVAVKGSDINASGGVANGLRVGSNTFTSSVEGSASMPAAAVKEMLGK